MLNLFLKLLFSIFFSSGIFSFLPISNYWKNISTNLTDTYGRKEGKWLYYGKDLPRYQYPDSNLVLEGTYLEGKKDGSWTRYYKDGKTPMFVANYKDNRPEGTFKKYNDKGVLIETGEFSNGKYSGNVSKYYDNGVQRFNGEFYDGKENGDISIYDKNGKTELAYSSFDGVVSNKNQNQQDYIASSEITQTNTKAKDKQEKAKENLPPVLQTYFVKNGTSFHPDGYNRLYNDKGDILQDGDFKNGKLYNGKLYKYDANGILYRIMIYKNGNYISDSKI